MGPCRTLLTTVLCASSTAHAHDEALSAALAADDRDLFYHVPASGLGEQIFADQVIAGPFDQAVGLVFDDLGRMFVWTKAGRLWFVDDEWSAAKTPVLDLSEEVGDWGDHGMLGLALDPAFTSNGFLYLFYAVDRHHLDHFGTPDYDPLVDEFWVASEARLSRYQLFDPTLPGEDLRVDPTSRTVLIGETPGTGFPICSSSHGVGSVAFGEDGSLLCSFGDSQGSGSEPACDGFVSPAEDIEAYRAQLTDSHCGKVLRVDPASGDGLPDNPYFDALRPDAPASRVWTSGLRQPFRLSVRPGTGGPGHPGTLYVGDVGAGGWEELDVVRDGGTNLGWPLYQGFEPDETWDPIETADLHSPNPLFGRVVPGVGLCEQEFFLFQDLLHPEVLGALDLPNPCDPSVQVPIEFQRHHTAPVLTWTHEDPVALAKTYQGGAATGAPLGEPGTQVFGDPFAGSVAIGGVWYSGTDFPAQYQNAYFLGDYSDGWIKCFRFDASDRPLGVLSFTDDAGGPVAFATHPQEGGLFYIDYAHPGGSVVRKITFVGDLPPVAAASVDFTHGPSPLVVQFSSDGSTDFGEPLTYEWDFGDGSPVSTAADPGHTFLNPGGAPNAFLAQLTVTDLVGQTDTATVLVSVDNTPPSVQITAPANGATYSSTTYQEEALGAIITDAEHGGAGQLECTWEVLLHHQGHIHPEPPEHACGATATVAPHAIPGEVEYYEMRLTATDAAGLATSASVWMVREDDCNLNGFPDQEIDLFFGLSQDANGNGVPDECESDCDADGTTDVFELVTGLAADCNENGVPDECDVAQGASLDLDLDGVPDECQALSAAPPTVSVGAGGTQVLSLNAGAEHAGDFYWVLGSLSGTEPATPFGPVSLPLAFDAYFLLTLTYPNFPPLQDTLGVLDSGGEAQALVVLGAGNPPGWAGLTLTHAAVVIDSAVPDLSGIELVTNPTTLELVP